MRALQVVAVFVVVVLGLGRASAERHKNALVPPVSASCVEATNGLASALTLSSTSSAMLSRRCTQDGWSVDAKACFRAASSPTEATLCLDTLSKNQRRALDGDADRLAETRLSRWLLGRTLTAVTPVTLASYQATHATQFDAPITDATVVDLGRARMLQKQAMTAYQAGNFEVASKTFSAAVQASPTPDNIYFAAQAYRMKGARALALEMYERYLEIAPDGPAAPACRYQIERLRDAIP